MRDSPPTEAVGPEPFHENIVCVIHVRHDVVHASVNSLQTKQLRRATHMRE